MNEENSRRNSPLLVLVVPCYNEEEIIEKSAGVLEDKLCRLKDAGLIAEGSRILFVDDGSKDSTFQILSRISKNNPVCCVLKLAGNCGHQNAILAGMMTAKDTADAVVTIDADLQQDIEALDLFLEKYREGCEIVYGVRNDRNSDGVMKRSTASLY